MISPEKEEWILTPEEEAAAIEYAIALRINRLKDPDLNERVRKANEHFAIPSAKQRLLEEANSNKHQQIWHEQQRLKRIDDAIKEAERIKAKCDANYFYNLIRSKANYVKFKQANFDYIKTLCFYFSNDKRFETELKLDANKGLWIRGEPGRGKTFPLQCIMQNELVPFQIHSMLQVAEDVAETGEYSITGYPVVIDDVGTEQSLVNHFGTKINWFKTFIELYYKDKKPFNRLIVTTNLDFEQVGTNYGFRVRSRIKEMFNLIDVKGSDLRS